MATRITYSASASYEFSVAPPETVRLEIVASSHQKAASAAVRALKAAHPGRQPSSIVVVLELGARVERAAGPSRGFGRKPVEVEGVAV